MPLVCVELGFVSAHKQLHKVAILQSVARESSVLLPWVDRRSLVLPQTLDYVGGTKRALVLEDVRASVGLSGGDLWTHACPHSFASTMPIWFARESE